MKRCSICGERAVYKIKGEKIFYCRAHAREFFDDNSLENIRKISKGAREADVLKEYLERISDE